MSISMFEMRNIGYYLLFQIGAVSYNLSRLLSFTSKNCYMNRSFFPMGVLALCLVVGFSTRKDIGLHTAAKFQDLNKNGKMDRYEDISQPVEARIEDLLKQMTIQEKAGLMFINGARVNDDGSITNKPGKGMFAFAPNATDLVRTKKMNHFNLWAIPDVEMLAKWYNNMQHYMRDSTRLGIPMTIASDPRHAFSSSIFAMS